MSFSARLDSDLITVEAGATVPVALEVANRSDEQDRYDIEIEGLDPEWTAVPVPLFAVEAREIQTEKLFFKPPRTSESLAGNYPFVVKVRSLVSGETRTVQGVLQIKPYNYLSMELQPKRGVVSPFKKQNDFQVTVMNLGNTEHTLQLVGNDPDEACAFEFEQEQVSLAPGQQKTIEVLVHPTVRKTFSSTQLHVFGITARSAQVPSVAATAQAQLEQRPFLSPASLTALVLLMALAALWVIFLPKQPAMDRLTLDRDQVLVGETANLSWEASDARSVRLNIDGEEVLEAARGSRTIQATRPGQIRVEAVAVRQDKRSEPLVVVLDVGTPEPVPPPEIVEFAITPRNLKLGETFVVRYRLGPSVVKASLAPTGETLNLAVSEQELTANRLGTIRYTLVAENATGSRAEKSISITVSDPTLPQVVAFSADPTVVDPAVGVVTLRWQFVNTIRQELVAGGQPPVDIAATGPMQVRIFETTTYTIRGWDAQGRKTEKTVKVEVREPPPPPVDSGTTGGFDPPPVGGGGG
ncbi:MAG TPA: hypothetical protein VM328_07805 [Fimbriimonadaceae bacterium]|nr:hypothetical protein [Fimbriimonadaceae bacterium]